MQPRLEAASMNLENTGHAGEFEFASVRLNKRVRHADCFAKYAAAFFRMSRSSVVRLSSALSLTLTFSACSTFKSLLTGSSAFLLLDNQDECRPLRPNILVNQGFSKSQIRNYLAFFLSRRFSLSPFCPQVRQSWCFDNISARGNRPRQKTMEPTSCSASACMRQKPRRHTPTDRGVNWFN